MEASGDLFFPEWRSLPALGEREVQVFRLRAGGDSALLERAQRLLTEAERERAGRIRVEGAREEFAMGRAALRVLLGVATGSRPESLGLATDAFGKPFVPGVHSNVSHSRGLIYVALCRAAPVGVDVEWVNPSLEALEIAEANFRPEETAEIGAEAAGRERARSFCRLWTRKEAIAKADGRGLQIPLRDIHVPDGAGAAWIEDGASYPMAWAAEPRMKFYVEELAAPEGYAAALAVRGVRLPVRYLPDLPTAQLRSGVL